MAPKKPRVTGNSTQSGHLKVQPPSASEKATLIIDYPTPEVSVLEEGDALAWLPSHVAVVSKDPSGTDVSVIKHFIDLDPCKWPTIYYDEPEDSDSLFVHDSNGPAPSFNDLSQAGWSPPVRYRLAPGESLCYGDTQGAMTRLSATKTDEFLEVRPQSIALFRPDTQNRSGASPSTLAHLFSVHRNQLVTFHGPQRYPYTFGMSIGDIRVWDGHQLREDARSNGLSQLTGALTNAPCAYPRTTRAATAEIRHAPTRRSGLAASRGSGAPNRAATRSSGKKA